LESKAYVYFFDQKSVVARGDNPHDRSFATFFVVFSKVTRQRCTLKGINIIHRNKWAKRSERKKNHQQRLILQDKAKLLASDFHAVF